MKHLHIICLSLVLFYGLSGFVSCSSDTAELPHEGGDDRDIFLTFQTAVAGVSSRAGEEAVGDDRVGTLRIVIVSKGNEQEAAWTVEHNMTVHPTTPLQQAYSFKVAAASRKRIYLIANEEGLVGTDGNPLDFGNDGLFIPQDNGKARIDDCVFSVGESYRYSASALPMTAVHEFDVPAANEVTGGEFNLPKILYLVRAATKFTFGFTNQSTERDITVTAIDVKNVITDRMYLMPHVNTKNGKYWVVEEKSTGDKVTYSERDLDKDWVDWMGQEAEDSDNGKDNEWLTDYNIPDGTTAQRTTFKDFQTEPMPKAVAGTEKYVFVKIPGAFYLPESRTEKADDQFKLQEYSITVHTVENGEQKEYSTVVLPHLASLFRNTHVIVGATFTDKDYSIDLTVDVIPFTSIELTPDMGLDREEFTGYIVGKDEKGNRCWYDATESPNDPGKRTPYYLGPKDNIGDFVTINDTLYLLVYTDNGRTARSLNHIFEKDTRKKHILSPKGRTGYEKKNALVDGKTEEWYQTPLKLRVWLDEGGDPEGSDDEKQIYEALNAMGLKRYRILYEWDRWEWSEALKGGTIYRPIYWYDVLGNRYPWSEGDTDEKRENLIGEWVNYLKDEE